MHIGVGARVPDRVNESLMDSQAARASSGEAKTRLECGFDEDGSPFPQSAGKERKTEDSSSICFMKGRFVRGDGGKG
jgi:hypothetical protein